MKINYLDNVYLAGESAEYLGITKKYVCYLARNGFFKNAQLRGKGQGIWLIPKEDLDLYLLSLPKKVKRLK